MNTPMKSGDELLIVDNADPEWKTLAYLHELADIARALDVATGYFEIGSLALDGQWQKLEKLRILMGDEVTQRTRRALLENLKARAEAKLDESLEGEEKNDFLQGVPAIVAALGNGQIECRVYTKKKFHAKAYITHARSRVGLARRLLWGLPTSHCPGLTQNIELNIQLRREVDQLQQWYEQHWEEAEDVSADILKIIQR